MSDLRLTWADDGALAVTGPGQDGYLAVVPASALATPAAVVPMAGRWETEGDTLRFSPRFPFSDGLTYALVRPDPWTEIARLHRPAADIPPTTAVLAIHPSTPEIPENLLRLSVTFSAPMAEGYVADHIHLQDADGHDLPYALLATPPELWDRPYRRLTLLLEPGRIKRGLVPNTELGPPLTSGTDVTLVVDAGLRDATGAALVADARRSFRVGPPVRSRVDPRQWRLSWPAAGSRDPMIADFDRPLDHALALRCLRVATSHGTTGRATLGPGQTRWTFTPDQPWPAGGCELHVDTALEDLAGNSVRRVFDRDLHLPQDDPLAATRIVLNPTAATRTETSGQPRPPT